MTTPVYAASRRLARASVVGLWVTDAAEARANPLRLDRRADWTTTGASPVGLAFRGRIDPAHHDEFWLYDALGPNIWIHRDNERSPQRPLVFVLEKALPPIVHVQGAHRLELVIEVDGTARPVTDSLAIRW